MFGATLKATNGSLQKGITLCRSIYVKKVMKLLAFIFEHPSYANELQCNYGDLYYGYVYALGTSLLTFYIDQRFRYV